MGWREAHHWLRGYSDALAGKGRNPLDFHDVAAYDRGYLAGLRRRGDDWLASAA